MIRAGHEYRAYKARVMKDKVTSISISDSEKNKETGEWSCKGWYSIFVEGVYEMEPNSGFKFKIERIKGCEQNVKGGRTFVTLYCDISVTDWGSVVPKKSTVNGQPNDEYQLISDTEDLPF